MPNRNQSTLPVIVAGGGIGGLAAALALAREGIPVRVLERADAFGEIGAGLQLAPNALRVLERLGALEAVLHDGVFPDYAVMIDALTGDEITRISLGAGFMQRFGHRYVVVHRQDLLRALLEQCRRASAVELMTGRGIVSFEDAGDRVRVACQDGSVHEGQALIGADGLYSVVRAALLADGPPRVAGHFCYRGTVPMDRIPDRSYERAMALWVGPDMHLVQYPVRQGQLMNNVVVIQSPRFRAGLADTGEWSEVESLFSAATPRVRGMLEYVDRSRCWSLHDRPPAPDWSRGRVTLLGDAAHPTLQNMAQGACMALEDAVCLADRITASGGDLPAAFLDYQQARYLRTARVQLSARFVASMVHAGGGARDVRNHVLAKRSHDSYFELAWLYDGP